MCLFCKSSEQWSYMVLWYLYGLSFLLTNLVWDLDGWKVTMCIQLCWSFCPELVRFWVCFSWPSEPRWRTFSILSHLARSWEEEAEKNGSAWGVLCKVREGWCGNKAKDPGRKAALVQWPFPSPCLMLSRCSWGMKSSQGLDEPFLQLCFHKGRRHVYLNRNHMHVPHKK